MRRTCEPRITRIAIIAGAFSQAEKLTIGSLAHLRVHARLVAVRRGARKPAARHSDQLAVPEQACAAVRVAQGRPIGGGRHAASAHHRLVHIPGRVLLGAHVPAEHRHVGGDQKRIRHSSGRSHPAGHRADGAVGHEAAVPLGQIDVRRGDVDVDDELLLGLRGGGMGDSSMLA